MVYQRGLSTFREPKVFLILAAIAILYVVALVVRNPFVGDILTMVFLFASLSLSWNILGGYGGQFSLGHAGFFGIGAYTSTLLLVHYSINPWLGMFIGGGLAAVIGGLVFYPCFKLKGIFFCLATLAFAEVLRIFAIHFRGLTEGSMGIMIPFKSGFSNMMFRGKTGYMLIALSLMVGIALLTLFLEKSRFGYKLIALKEDEDATEAMGISTAKCKLLATLISSFLTGCLGTFYAHYTLLIDPESIFNVMLSVEFALFAILGGIGTVLGPILGAFVLIPIDALFRGYLTQAQGVSLFAYGTLLIVVVIFLPRGMMSWFSDLISRSFGMLKRDKNVPEAIRIKVATGSMSTVVPRRTAGDFTSLLEVSALTKNFGGLRVIDGLDMTVRQGEIVGLIGPNGAGKTTLFNLITGFHKPDKGSVVFKGRNITGWHPPNKVSRLGIVRTFQIVRPLAGLTVMENVIAGSVEKSRNIYEAKKKSHEIISLVGLEGLKDTNAASLTLESRKRLELARALASEPQLLLLDEVMAGLNPTEIEEAIKLIRRISQWGITLLVIEHVMKAVMSLADRVIVVNYGKKICEGLPREVVKDNEVIKAYLGKGFQYAER